MPILKNLGIPIVWDCSHSLAFAEGKNIFWRCNEHVPFLARAEYIGADGFFLETHPDPNSINKPKSYLSFRKILKIITRFEAICRCSPRNQRVKN